MSLTITLGAALALGLAVALYSQLTPTARLGRITYADDAESAPTLTCRQHRLAGRPDRILLVWRPLPEHRPVEVKTIWPPDVPRESDVAQLLGQAALVAAQHGRYPRKGYLVYDHPEKRRVHAIRLGPAAEALTTDWLTRLRRDL